MWLLFYLLLRILFYRPFLLLAFGFCEYREPESSLCALRLLHGLELGGRKLLVKVDAKTKALLDEWKMQHRPRSKASPSEVWWVALPPQHSLSYFLGVSSPSKGHTHTHARTHAQTHTHTHTHTRFKTFISALADIDYMPIIPHSRQPAFGKCGE